MRYYFMTIFSVLACSCILAQKNDSTIVLNKNFEVHVDSIEREITVNKWGNDTSYYLHYTIKNTSIDTLTYTTNSCFYYNHYILKVAQFEFDLNSDGGCLYNQTTPHSLLPGESFYNSEWIISTNLNMNILNKGEYSAILYIPIVKDANKVYRVDGREFVKNEEYLIFDKQTKIVEKYVINRKRKRNSA